MKNNILIIMLIGSVLLFSGASPARDGAFSLYTHKQLSSSYISPIQSIDEQLSLGRLIDTKQLSTDAGEININVYNGNNREATTYSYPSKDIFVSQRMTKIGDNSLTLRGDNVNIRWYDGKRWHESTQIGALPHEMLWISVGNNNILLTRPYTYASSTENTIVWTPKNDGKVTLNKISDNEYELKISLGSLPQNGFADWWLLWSQNELADLSDENIRRLWTGYQLTGDMRWCYDGFYELMPSEYTSYKAGAFFLNPAAHTPLRFILTGGSNAAYDLGIAMLDIHSQNYNKDGYIQTIPKCTWVYDAFGIGGNFYDTRFNTDVAEGYLKAQWKFGVQKFGDIAKKYADYLVSHVNNHGVAVSNGYLTGLFSPDYYSQDVTSTAHTALNHQAVEITFLYHMGGKYIETADMMLSALKITSHEWVRNDGNLHYCRYADGTYGKTDYDYLTYNDLYDLQETLLSLGREKDEDIAYLMCEKQAYMDKNKIKAYKK